MTDEAGLTGVERNDQTLSRETLKIVADCRMSVNRVFPLQRRRAAQRAGGERAAFGFSPIMLASDAP